MSRINYLRDQIERAKRFAAAMTNSSDRERFEGLADKYQRELDALSSPAATSAATSAPSDAVAEPSAPDTPGPSDAIAATDDGDTITSSDPAGQQEKD